MNLKRWTMSNENLHKGNLLKVAVKNSGIKISQLARILDKSRRFFYVIFDKKNVPEHYVTAICEIINCEFNGEIIQKKQEAKQLIEKDICWKDKYLLLLEEHNKLLKIHYGKN